MGLKPSPPLTRLRFSRAARLLLVAAAAADASAPSSAAAPPPKPCFGRLNSTFPFEEACFTLLHTGTDGLSLREYAAAAARGGVRLLAYNASASSVTYQNLLEIGSFNVIQYFTGPGNSRNEPLLTSRTVPLALRPPTRDNDSWLVWMALSPSKWPASKAPPVPLPKYGVALVPLGIDASAAGPLLIAVQRATSKSVAPQQADFDELCAKGYAAVATQLPGYAFDEASPLSPTHARYFSQLSSGPFDYECWLAVTKK
jgi:hypothetical protein